jgi:hypothetical protein
MFWSWLLLENVKKWEKKKKKMISWYYHGMASSLPNKAKLSLKMRVKCELCNYSPLTKKKKKKKKLSIKYLLYQSHYWKYFFRVFTVSILLLNKFFLRNYLKQFCISNEWWLEFLFVFLQWKSWASDK